MTDYVAELRKKRQTESVLKSIGTAERLAQQQQSVLQSIQSDSAARKSFNEYTANTRYGFGNVDLTNRPKYYNDDGSVSTVRSMSFYDEDEAREILVPTVASVGGTVRLLSDDEARARYYATGEHLGKFNTPEQATEYAMALHNAQQAQVERQRARTSFDFDEDEGTYRWNGKTYASREELTRAMNAAGLSAEEQTSVARKAQSSGSGVVLHNNRFMSTEEQAQAIERERLAAIDLTAQKKKLDELKAQLRTEKAKSAGGRTGRHRADADRAAQDRIAADIRTLEHEMIQAETVQKADDFYRVWQKQDFDATARKGGAKAGNLVMRARRGQAKNLQEAESNDYRYTLMNDDEVRTYNYYFETDEKKAGEYLKFLEEELNRRQGVEQGEAVRGIENAAGRAAMTVAYGIGAGLDQFASGTRQFFSSDRLPTSAAQFGSAYIREDLGDVGAKLPDWLAGATAAQVGYDALTTGANMAPSILLASLTGGIGGAIGGAAGAAISGAAGTVGAVSMGAAAAGNAYNQALAEGKTKREARLYSTMIGLSEAFLQETVGGIVQFGGTLANVPRLRMAINNMDSALLRTASNLGVNMLFEGLEEYAQDILEPVFRNLFYGEHNDTPLWTEDAMYSFLLGAITAGFLDAPQTISNGVSINRMGAQIAGNHLSDNLVEVALRLDPETEAYHTAQDIRSGKLRKNTHNIGELFLQYAGAGGDLSVFDAGVDRRGRIVTDAGTGGEAYARMRGIVSARENGYTETGRLDAVASEYLNLDMGQGSHMGLETARRNADIVIRYMNGETITPQEVKRLNLTQRNTRALFEEFTGVELPEDFNKLSPKAQIETVLSAQSGIQMMTPAEAAAAENTVAPQERTVPFDRGTLETATPQARQDGLTIDSFGELYRSSVNENASDEEIMEEFRSFLGTLQSEQGLAPTEAEAWRMVRAQNLDGVTVMMEGGRSADYNEFKALAREQAGAQNATEQELRTAFLEIARAQGRVDEATYNQLMEGTDYGEGRNGLHDGGLPGEPGERSGEQAGRVDETAGGTGAEPAGAEGAVPVPGGRDGADRAETGRRGLNQEQADTVRALNLGTEEVKQRGKNREALHAVTETERERVFSAFPALRELDGNVRKYGGRLTMLLGGIDTGKTRADGSKVYADGMFRERSREVTVQLDSEHFAAENLGGHELAHLRYLADAEYRATVNGFVSALRGSVAEQFVRERYDSKGGPYTPVIGTYNEANASEFFQELVADLYGNVNRQAMDAAQFAALRENLLRVVRELDERSAGATENLRLETESGLTAVNGAQEVAETTYRVEGEITDAAGETVAQSDDEGHSRFSLRTYDESGRQVLSAWLDKAVQKGDLTRKDADALRRSVERIYEVCRDHQSEYAPFDAWSEAKVTTDANGNPVFSVVKRNGEYAMNLDFSLVCKKRRTLDAVLNELVRRGLADTTDLGQEGIVRINDIIRSHGFETACALCFVDSKRFRQADVADSFVRQYNRLVESLIPEGSGLKADHFNFGGNASLDEEGIGIRNTDDSALDFTEIDRVLREEAPNKGVGSIEYRIAEYLKAHPEGRALTARGDFISTAGFNAASAENPELLSLFSSKKGAGGPKNSVSDVQYLNEVLKPGTFNRKAAYSVGGVRIQSFSDYVPRMVFDYVQMVADLAAKKLPAHAYTKEELFARQFGLTGIKINMSLIPAVAEGGIAAGLDADGGYVWADESFDFDTAVSIQNADGYGENCGTIAVGVSDEHIRKLLADPDIRMVIPYHKSGLNPIVAEMNNIAAFTDYTNEQNTRDKDGKRLSKEKNTFHFTERLNELGRKGDPRAVAEEYVRWCEDNGYLPMFDQFAYKQVDGVSVERNGRKVVDENYYKLLEDFTVYDRGKYVPQRDLQMKFPTETDAFGSMQDLILRGLDEDAVLEGRRDAEVGRIVDEIAGEQYSVATDSTGRELTLEQQEYFKNSVVRDDEGHLVPVYHGTPAGGFNTFQMPQYLSKLMSSYGGGFYFTTNKQQAELYTKAVNKTKPKGARKKIYEVYLNITNPLELSAKDKPKEFKITKDQLRELIRRGDREWFKTNGMAFDAGFVHQAEKEAAAKMSFEELLDHYVDYQFTHARYTEDLLSEAVAAYEGGSNALLDAMHDVLGYDGIKYTYHPDNVFYVAWAQNQIKNVNNPNPTEDADIRYSIAGETAENADRGTLARARQLDADGKSAEETWKETGWWKGQDGEWRFEIDDSKMVFHPERLKGRRAVELQDVIDHDLLFENYPMLRYMTVDAGIPAATKLNGRHTLGRISLRENLSAEDMAGTLLHEIQHEIQSLEDFAEGANMEVAYRDLFVDTVVNLTQNDEKALDRLAKLTTYQGRVRMVERLMSKVGLTKEELSLPGDERLFLALYRRYRSAIGEQEANDTKARHTMSEEERRENTPYLAQEGLNTNTSARVRDSFYKLHEALGAPKDFLGMIDKPYASGYNKVRKAKGWGNGQLDLETDHRKPEAGGLGDRLGSAPDAGRTGERAEGNARRADVVVIGRPNRAGRAGDADGSQRSAEEIPSELNIEALSEALREASAEAGASSVSEQFSITEYSPEEQQEHVRKAIKHFGKTYSWNETGYLTPDGTRIDFSGRHDGAPGGYRTVDHRDISDALGLDYGGGGYSDAMVQFMSEGNIRIMPENNGINMQKEPTKAQYEALRRFISMKRGEVIVDYDNSRGDTVFSKEYDRGTSTNEIIGDIERRFRSGAEKGESLVAQFHTMYDATNADEAEDSGFRYSLVTDPATLDFLNNQETIKVYRAMQLIDGKLYPPMAAKVAEEAGKGKKRRLVDPTEFGQWYRSDEHPELADDKGMFILDKANGSTVPARYNPYFHTSATPLNDQFSSAWDRPNLVTVEVEIPKSELTSGYKAEKAKNSVGETKWHAGPVASQLKGDKARRVFLSRWAKVNRIIPDAEVASVIAKTLEGENISIPENVITPSLKAELEKAGVRIGPASKKAQEARNRAQVKSDEKFSVADYNKTALLQESTVDKYLKDYAAESTPNYAQAYITWMSPKDFLDLTTSRQGRARIDSETTPLDVEGFGEATRHQPFQLRIDHETGEINGHEGRHRANALLRAGVERIPVLMFDSSNKYDKAPISELVLKGQDFGSNRSTAEVTARDLIPLNYANRDEIVKAFGTQPTLERMNERYNGAETVRYSVSPETEAEYDRAVESGNTDEAARIVRETADKAGYTVEAYHGTMQFGFTRIDTGKSDDKISFFATNDPLTAQTYSASDGVREVHEKGYTVAELEDAEDKAINALRSEASSLAGTLSGVAGVQGFIDVDDLADHLLDIVDSGINNNEQREVVEDQLFEYLQGLASDVFEYTHRDVDPLDNDYEYQEWVESKEGQRVQTALDDAQEKALAYLDARNLPAAIGNYHLFINPEGMLEVEGNGANWNNIPFMPDELKQMKARMDEIERAHVRGTGPLTDNPEWLDLSNRFDERAEEILDKYHINPRAYSSTREIARYAVDNGYTGVRFKDIVDDGGQGMHRVYKPSDVYIMFNPQAQAKSADPVTYADDGTIIPLSERFNASDDDIRYSVSPELKQWFELQKQYGTMPESRGSVRAAEVPQRTEKNNRVSRTAATVMGAQATPEGRIDTIAQAVVDGKLSYEPLPNKVAANKARNQLKLRGWSESVREWKNAVDEGRSGADLVAMGATLLNNAGNSEATGEEYIDLLTTYSDLLRRSGQAVQAAKILQKLTPEAKLYGIQKTIDKMNQKAMQRAQPGDFDPTTGEFNGIQLDPGLVEEYNHAQTDEERNEIIERMAKDVASKTKTTAWDRLTAWRYLNMLGNFRTQVRNVLGNAGFQPVRMLKDSVVGLTEAMLQKAGVKIDRSSSVLRDAATWRAAGQVFKEYQDAILAGGKYQDDTGLDFAGMVNDNRRIFGNTKYKAWNRTVGAVLEGYRKSTNTAMDVGDAVFCSFTFRDSLARFMAANQTTWNTASEELRTRAVNKAIRDAAEATYRDNNEIAAFLSRAARSDTTPAIFKVLGEGVMPFRKTPANILMRSYEYSPLSIIGNTITDIQAATGRKTVSANEIVEQWAKTFTGTGLVALGYALASMGRLIGKAPDDDKENALFKQEGYQAYSLVANGHTFTLDWAAPEAIPLFLGANIAQEGLENGLSLKDGLDAIMAIGDPLFEMSMLQGINDALESVGTYGVQNALVSFVANAAMSYASQFGSSTLAGQIERASDNTRMQTYVDKNGTLPVELQRQVGKFSAKTPGWDYGQIPYVDAWGEVQENADSQTWNVITQLFSPSYVSRVEHTYTLDELSRLYDATGKASVILDTPNKYFTVNGERKDLTADEYLTYAITRGQTAKRMLADLFTSAEYRNLSDAEKVSAVSKVYDYANQQGKAAVSAYEPESWVGKMSAGAQEHGINEATYTSVYTKTKDIVSMKDKNGETVANSKSLQIMAEIYATPGLSDEQVQYLAEALGVGKTVRGYSQKMVERKLAAMHRLYDEYN